MLLQVHFIWFGGIMPKPAVNTIRRWNEFLKTIKKNDFRYQINLWIDKIGADEHHIERLSRDFHGIVTFIDITEAKISNQLVRYEIDRFRPNYGAASDIVRYKILQRRRGLYLDIDVQPPESNESFSNVLDIQDLVMPNQFMTELGSQCSDCIFYNGTNDHPFIDFMIEETENNYRVGKQDFALSAILRHRYKLSTSEASCAWRQAYLADMEDHRFAYTLRAGANYLISDWIQQQCALKNVTDEVDKLHERAGYRVVDEAHMRIPLQQTKSALSWKNRAIIFMPNLEQAVSKTISTIRFEIEFRGVLRLDDHIQNAIESLSGVNIKTSEIVSAVIDSVHNVLHENDSALLNKITVAQLTFLFPEVSPLYKDLNLLKKTCLLDMREDNNDPNYSTKDLLKYAHQPIASIHLLSQEMTTKTDLPERSSIKNTGTYKRAAIAFLLGTLNFYYKHSKSILDENTVAGSHRLFVLRLTYNLHIIADRLKTLGFNNSKLYNEIGQFQQWAAQCKQLLESQQAPTYICFNCCGFFGKTSLAEQPSLPALAILHFQYDADDTQDDSVEEHGVPMIELETRELSA